MTSLTLLIVTLLSAFLVVYHHLGYPLILRWFYKKNPHNTTQSQPRKYANTLTDQLLPTIAVVIPAYNEAQWIAEKIRNLAALDYPNHRLQVVIACDGCTDDTYALACQTVLEPECQDLSIKICHFSKNRGKVALLNEQIALLECDLIALSDTSAILSIDALLLAAQRFNDPQLGVLNGHYQLQSPGSIGEQSYWLYQSKIKQSEAALGSTLGAHGAFYVFRRHLFTALAVDTINDDFILPMQIVAAGYKAAYEQNINTLELEQSTQTQDQQRRRRIAAGNFQQLLRLKKLFLPRYGRVAFAFISGKGLRMMMPFLMIITLLGSLILAANYVLFIALSVVQLCAYLLASWELLYQPSNSNKISKLLGYLVAGHIANGIGTLRYILRLDKGHWKKINH